MKPRIGGIVVLGAIAVTSACGRSQEGTPDRGAGLGAGQLGSGAGAGAGPVAGGSGAGAGQAEAGGAGSGGPGDAAAPGSSVDQDAAAADAAVGVGNGGAAGGTTGNQPLGGLCTLDRHCSQSEGAVVCCAAQGCTGPCECTLESDCSDQPLFLPCEASADCAQYGGGKICCQVGSGDQSMNFCTKRSACSGTVLD